MSFSKRIVFYLFILANLNCFASFGNIDNLDSLLKMLPAAKGENEADILLNVSQIYFENLEEYKNSEIYADKALAAALKLNYQKGLAKAYLIKARLQNQYENYDKAEQFYLKALSSFNLKKSGSSLSFDKSKQLNDDPFIGKIIADINYYYGAMLSEKLNLSKSVEKYLTALGYYESAQNLFMNRLTELMKFDKIEVTDKEPVFLTAMQYYNSKHDKREANKIVQIIVELKAGIRNTCLDLGDKFSKIKDKNQAVYFLKKGLRNAEESGENFAQLQILNTLSEYYLKIKDYDSCITYATKFRMNSQKQKKIVFIAVADQLLGTSYSEKGELMKAIEFNKDIDRLLEPLRNGKYKGDELYDWVEGDDDAKSISLAQSAFNYAFMGDIYARSGDHRVEAKDNYLLAIRTLQLAGENDAIVGVHGKDLEIYLNRKIGELYSKAGNNTKGLKMLEVIIPDMEKSDDKEELLSFYKSLYECYDINKDTKNAYIYYKKYEVLKDSLFGLQNLSDITEVQKRFEVEKKDAAIELLNKGNETHALELDKQKLVRNGLICGFLILMLFALIVLRNLQQNKRAKKIIENQKILVEEKNKEITDSINYAERIQRSFIATKEILDQNLNDYFVFFKPKDIVSGDFYWASILNNGNFALATADSTGHGVPGAIMSLLNITSLEKAIETLTEPSEILNSTRKTIIERLKKDGSEHGGKDGMDASLISFDFKNKKLIVAAANNPVWIIRRASLSFGEGGEGEAEVIEIKPDKMPVGKHDRDTVSFTQQEIDLQTGDVVYTLTDGFPDQFGGEKGKKFMSKNLRELLASNSHLPMHEQKQVLEKTFADWVGVLEQIDDVTLIGVRI